MPDPNSCYTYSSSYNRTMLWKIDAQSTQPLHEQLAGQIRRGIATQELEEGEKLPPARDLAKGLGVNMHTVLRAFQTLRDEGLLEVRRGRGTSVARDAKSATRQVELARRLVKEARRAGLGNREILQLVEVQL